jgi:Mn-dependent DtxR family transcriptional regulator
VHILGMVVRCKNCGGEYHRTSEKFLVPHTGHASCTICGDTLEYWVDDTHVAIFELIRHPDESPKDASQTQR